MSAICRTLIVASVLFSTAIVEGQVCNVKVVTDANPDYYDLPSLVHSATSRWSTPEEKCWAMYYWNHIARRQTAPMQLHGLELTDPIRQFNDYGYTMCSTVSGINCGIWREMGLDTRLWDITLHTVSECFYDDAWHMYDNSMSALYTRCDGKTIASVEEIGQEGACAASGGKREAGHIAKYHCLYATSANGFLTGADCPRDLAQEYRCFTPSGLKHRWYYKNWDVGHRYILNLRPGEVYTRYYHSLGKEPRFYVPNGGKDPEAANARYRIRGNGRWTFEPKLTPTEFRESLQEVENLEAIEPQGLQPVQAGRSGMAVFKIQSANVATGQTIRAQFVRRTERDAAAIDISTTGGRTWTNVWKAEDTGELPVNLDLMPEVNGAYEILVKITLQAAAAPADAQLKRLAIETVTMLNSKTQPQLRLGRNTVYVGLGEQSDSIVYWPELQAGCYRPYIIEEKNLATEREHSGWKGVMHPAKPNDEAYVVYRIDAPADVTRITYGGRFYNRAPKSEIRMQYSTDGGQTWQGAWRLADIEPPWDTIHYEKVDGVPPGVRSVLVKYSLQSPEAAPTGCSIYAMRMEVNHRPVSPMVKPIDVTFTWNEVQADRTLVRRSHTERVEKTPDRYTINVGGADHPVVESLRVSPAGTDSNVRLGYSDGRDAGGERVLDRRVTVGRNLLEGKPYTVSVTPTGQYGSADPEGKKLTDGIVGANYAGGTAMSFACGWDQKSGPVEIDVDMGEEQTVGAARVHLTAGWPWWDALSGEVEDRVEVFTSLDGNEFASHGEFELDLRRKDIPINHMLADEETARGWNFEKALDGPVRARYVRFRLTPKRIVGVTEVQALDRLEYEPFDMKIALPDDR